MKISVNLIPWNYLSVQSGQRVKRTFPLCAQQRATACCCIGTGLGQSNRTSYKTLHRHCNVAVAPLKCIVFGRERERERECVCVCEHPLTTASSCYTDKHSKTDNCLTVIHEYEILLVDNHEEFAQENPRKQRRFGDNNPKSVERS